MGRTTRLVLAGPVYAAVAVVAAAVALTGFVLSQNLPFTADALAGRVPAAALLELYPFVGISYDPVTGTVLLLVSFLVGVDIALVAYHVREHRLSAEGGGGSLLGVLLGTLGAGCAACGSAILAGVLSLFGAAGLVTLLPLDGLEFALLALAALVLSIHWLADGMRGGEIRGCPVDLQK
ncbi:hypothetical protein DU500_11060 [Haloplanus rubicundus]|uniref:Uncharacterized protein n=1 Tax=Haloplanus rubicundus TaxID=1547898 RepID=A0A345EI08_9EURY|nr:hypothetical protein [Haloplanus rubicundus]AXG08120.1 hypothetical protein DU500_11060 [Haloplanus rubicundus]AXG11830.1 hypothetical protein DU484_10805 [Haloplanus rubicundus]